MSRVVVWFSCGAASAVAAKLALATYPKQVEVVYCNTLASEHPDNARFMRDVQKWLGQAITVIVNPKYSSVDEVFMQTRYMAGIAGARCTVEMKKVPRFVYQQPDDIHIFGYTAEEGKRIRQFESTNPELRCDWILHRNGWKKQDCLDQLKASGIELPVMYSLGFPNNNCIGCVKATSPAYWQKVRQNFPEVFKRRAEQSRELGVRLVRIKGQRKFLDEMPEGAFGPIVEDISCGPHCAPADTGGSK